MKTLTLDQVLEAGRYATIGESPREWRYEPVPDAWGQQFWQLGVGNYKARTEDDPFLPKTGWRHIRGCDCEYCA